MCGRGSKQVRGRAVRFARMCARGARLAGQLGAQELSGCECVHAVGGQCDQATRACEASAETRNPAQAENEPMSTTIRMSLETNNQIVKRGRSLGSLSFLKVFFLRINFIAKRRHSIPISRSGMMRQNEVKDPKLRQQKTTRLGF